MPWECKTLLSAQQWCKVQTVHLRLHQSASFQRFYVCFYLWQHKSTQMLGKWYFFSFLPWCLPTPLSWWSGKSFSTAMAFEVRLLLSAMGAHYCPSIQDHSGSLSPWHIPSTTFGFWSILLLFSHSFLSDSATLWTAACQASLSFAISQSLLRLMSIESMMPSNHLILCHPLLLLPSIFPSIRVFSNESALCIRWPKYIQEFSKNPRHKYFCYKIGMT